MNPYPRITIAEREIFRQADGNQESNAKHLLALDVAIGDHARQDVCVAKQEAARSSAELNSMRGIEDCIAGVDVCPRVHV